MGKTALAVHWAQRVRGMFPDGQLYIDLRGFDPLSPATTAAEAVRAFLEALHVPPRAIPGDLDAGYNFYCSGSRNVTNPWVQVTCVPYSGGLSHNVRWTYQGTKYAPFSFGQYQGCASRLDIADNPQWGPK